MAQFVHQYVTELLKRQDAVGIQLGVDIYGVDRQLYVVDLTILTALGVIMKQITAVAPAVTDQVWIDALSHALDGTWPPDMLNQVDPNAPPPGV